jgi:hypothetical protein
MTARKNGLPVQFTFFAFLPEVLGGVNSYLDPEAVRRQRTLISSVVARFHEVPFLALDFNQRAQHLAASVDDASQRRCNLFAQNVFANWVRTMRGAVRATGSTQLVTVGYGKGRIFWADPVEIAEGTDAAAALYQYVAGRAGVTSMFGLQAPVSTGVLIFPIVLKDSAFYIMSSESADDAAIDLRDEATGVALKFKLPAQRAAFAVISKKGKVVVAKYGF